MRRRRFTIAALILLVLGGTLWWSTRLKIDPRLVGTWKLATRIADYGGEVTYQLDADGFGTQTTQEDYVDHITWNCDGRKLRIGLYENSGRGSFAAARLAALPGGRHLLPAVPPLAFDEFTVFLVMDDMLRMSHTTPGVWPDDDVPEKRCAEFRRVR